MSEPLLTADELGKELRIDPGTIRRWSRDGKITAHKIGGVWRYWMSEVLEHPRYKEKKTGW